MVEDDRLVVKSCAAALSAFLFFLTASAYAASASFQESAPWELLIQTADDRNPTSHSPPGWTIESAERLIPLNLNKSRSLPPRSAALRKRLERAWRLRFKPTKKSLNLDQARRYYERQAWTVWAEPNWILRPCDDETIPNDPEWENLWNLRDIQMPKAWSVQKGKSSVVVAVIDSGSDLEHPDLQGQFWRNADEIDGNGLDDDGNGYVDDIIGWDFTHAPTVLAKGDYQTPDPIPQDETGHGTHVSGIVLARPDNGKHTAGVAWRCKLMVLRSGFAGAVSGVGLQSDDSAEAIVYAAENGADVVNMSWGSEGSSFLLRDAIRYAHSMGVFMSAAVGNDGDLGMRYPAAFPETFAVAASDIEGSAAEFTSGYAAVDLAAPGSNILSLHLNEGLRRLSGTSMSTAHVSGAAALMKAKRPALRAAEIASILKASADALVEERALLGVKKLNVYQALLASESLAAEIDPRMPPGASESLRVTGWTGGPRYAGWRLLYGNGRAPELFEQLTETRGGDGRVEFLWSTAELPEGEYLLRLEALGAEGRTARDHRLIVVDRTPPRLQSSPFVKGGEPPLFASVLSGGLLRRAAWCVLDDESFIEYAFEGGQALRNAAPARRLLSSVEAEGVVSYTFRARNLAGLELKRSGAADLSPHIPNPYSRTDRFTNRLPPLNIARRAVDFNGNGVPEIVGGAPGGLRMTQVYELNAILGLRSAHRFPTTFTPLDIGDADGDGLLEIAGLEEGTLVVYEAEEKGAFPSARREVGEPVYGARYLDMDGDGRQEIVARRGSAEVAVAAPTGNDFAFTSILRIETEGENWIKGGFIALEADGAPRLTVADLDGDLVSFEYAGGQLRQAQTQRLPFTRVWTASSAGSDGALILGENEQMGPLGALVLYRWRNGAFAQDESFEPLWVSGSSTESRLAASPSGELAVAAGGWAYVLKEGALVWSSPIRLGASPVFLADFGAESTLAFDTSVGLRMTLPSADPLRADAPFFLQAEPISEQTARLTWIQPKPNDAADIFRADNGGAMRRLASGVAGGEYLDSGVSVGSSYVYQVISDFVRSNRAAAVISRQPRLEAAEAADANRLRLLFTEPMGGGGRYVVSSASGVLWEARSALSSFGSRRLLLTLDRQLEAGDYTVRSLTPRLSRSQAGMPLDPARSSVSFHYAPPEPTVYSDLSRARVYPNPVSASRGPARVRFDGLPPDAQVSIYGADGQRAADGSPAPGASFWEWRLRNARSEPVAPGVYLFAVEWDGKRRFGKLAVVR